MPVALLAAFWLLGRPYRGIAHDASVYLALGLRRLDPQGFAEDLFFIAGAQDAYSVFPVLYAPLIAWLGAGPAALCLTAIGQCGFFAAGWLLAGRFAQGCVRWWSVALLAAISGYYGSGVFRIAEPFATARTLAEPLVVLALALALGSRTLLAFGLLGIAALLHPLVAVPGIAVLVLCILLNRFGSRMTAVASVGVLSGLALAAALLPGAGSVIDVEWRAILQSRTPHLFLTSWQWPDWSRLVWGVVVAGLAAPHLAEPARRLTLAVIVTAMAGIAISLAGVDLYGHAMLTAAQPWRAQWLLQFLAIVLLPVAISNLWKHAERGRMAAALLAASACMGRGELLWAACLSLVAVALVYLPLGRSPCAGTAQSAAATPALEIKTLEKLVLLGAMCVAAVGLLLQAQVHWPASYGASGGQAQAWTRIAASGALLMPLAVLASLLLHTGNTAGAKYARRGQAAAALLSVAVLAASASLWDARSAWMRYLEGFGSERSALALPPGAQVYWQDTPAPAWLALHRASWFSEDQGAGLVFHRATAIEYAARSKAIAELHAASQNCRFGSSAGIACRIPLRAAHALCARAGAPHFLVLPAALASDIEARALPPYAGTSARLYDCARILAGSHVHPTGDEPAAARPREPR